MIASECRLGALRVFQSGAPQLTPDPSNPYPWYAIQCRTRYEKTVQAGLIERGYPSFLPLYRSRRRWSDRSQDVDLPLFPGYVFSRLDIANRLPVLVMPGVLQFVSAGKTPLPVDENEVSAIQAIVDSGLLVQPWPFLKTGQTVMIEEGPLKNVAGILTYVDGSPQIVVSITLLQRSVSVTVPRSWIRPAEGSLPLQIVGEAIAPRGGSRRSGGQAPRPAVTSSSQE